MPARHRTTARSLAADALARAAKRFPDLPPSSLEPADLSAADLALARAIHMTALRRWITIEYLLDRLMRRPMARQSPAVRAVLLSGAAQLIAMDRIPAYAVIDESVSLVKAMRQPKAAGMVNAVLRRLSGLIGPLMPDQPWQPARDRFPVEHGTRMLNEPCLPKLDNMARHLEVATSHPLELVLRWIETFGHDAARDLCVHDTLTPPVWVHDGDAVREWEPGDQSLEEYLTADPRRRVQDPAAADAVNATADLTPKTILDYCAGRGTKTRQLAVLHPDATILATDTDAARRADLAAVSEHFHNVHVIDPDQLGESPVDLLVLDVPCSNTAVLARRPEARYRFNRNTLDDLAALQKRIIDRTLPGLRRGGWMLYSTCSLEPKENRGRVDDVISSHDATLVTEKLRLPSATGGPYHDGGYHALVRVG